MLEFHIIQGVLQGSVMYANVIFANYYFALTILYFFELWQSEEYGTDISYLKISAWVSKDGMGSKDRVGGSVTMCKCENFIRIYMRLGFLYLFKLCVVAVVVIILTTTKTETTKSLLVETHQHYQRNTRSCSITRRPTTSGGDSTTLKKINLLSEFELQPICRCG